MIDRRGTRAGHRYELLGHSVRAPVKIEPFLITLDETSDAYPVFQHAGYEFIYMLSGEVTYRHADRSYTCCSRATRCSSIPRRRTGRRNCAGCRRAICRSSCRRNDLAAFLKENIYCWFDKPGGRQIVRDAWSQECAELSGCF